MDLIENISTELYTIENKKILKSYLFEIENFGGEKENEEGRITEKIEKIQGKSIATLELDLSHLCYQSREF